jgi:hypothetical protein
MKKFALAAVALLALATPAFAEDQTVLTNACTDAARQYFGDFEARTEMRADDPRVDGTRTAGGTIYLETRSADVRCGFPAKELRLTEFFVDGEDKLSELQSGGSAGGGGSASLPNYDRPMGGVLPEGSSFTASTIIQCSRGDGSGMTQCDAGIVREGNGNGFIMVFWPDVGSRVLYFENGEIVRFDESQADGGAKLAVTRDGDMQIVTIGEAQFEIIDAMITGG